MNLQHMRYAIEVERTGSISRAAESLYMGQPNLSKAIKDLETSVGISIFKRTPKGVAPTEQGAEFLKYAKSILSQIEEMESHYRTGTQLQSFRISVPRASYIAHAFTEFVSELDMEQGMEIDFRETNSMAAVRNIVEEGFSLGILRFKAQHESYFAQYTRHAGLKWRELWEFEYLALISAQHPLAEKDVLDYSDLDDSIEIVHGDLAVPYMAGSAQAQAQQKQKRRILVYERGSEFDLLSRIHNTYMWVSPMPQDVLQRNGLVQKACAGQDGTYKDVLVYPDGYKFTKMDQRFLDVLEEVRKAVAADALSARMQPLKRATGRSGYGRRFSGADRRE